jgi:hypothetical protein
MLPNANILDKQRTDRGGGVWTRSEAGIGDVVVQPAWIIHWTSQYRIDINFGLWETLTGRTGDQSERAVIWPDVGTFAVPVKSSQSGQGYYAVPLLSLTAISS